MKTQRKIFPLSHLGYLNDGSGMGIGNGGGFRRLAPALALVSQLTVWAEQPGAPLNPSTAIQSSSLLNAFQVKKGFRIELVASSSMVSSPVAMAFDENGRLFVAEMRDYPDRRAQIPHSGRVRLLEDSDGDGVFDSSRVYAEDLAWPSAVACYGGGLFVAATPEILYFKDSARKVVFTGFGTVPANPNSEALLNNFVWGLDNRIHGGSADIGGLVTSVAAPGSSPVALDHADFCFDPRTSTLFAEAGSAHTGMSFDVRGRKYVSDLLRPLQTAMFELRYFGRNPFVIKAPELIDVMEVAPRIFRFSSDPEMAGSARPLRLSAISSNGIGPALMIKGRSCLVYRGNAFPSNYLNDVFIADPEAHIIHRAVLIENGLEIVARRAREEATTEFLIARDPSFHPTQIIAGPDGAIYIADFQGGGESGRIFRIVPEDFKQPKSAQLANAKTYDLVAMLAHTDGWHRDTAARLLYDRRDATSATLLTNMLNNSRLPQARLQALLLLDGIGALTEGLILKSLHDTDERVREHAVRLSERFVNRGKVSDVLWSRLSPLAADTSIRVRYQLAFTLGEIDRPERVGTLIDILQGNPTNRWFQAAVLSSVGHRAGDLFIGMASDRRWRNDPAGQAFLAQLALITGIKGQLEEVSQVLNFLNGSQTEPQVAFALLSALGEGLHRIGSSLALVDPQGQLQRLYDKTLDVALDTTASDAYRIEALHLHGLSPYAMNAPGDILQLLFGTGQSDAVQSATITALGHYENPAVATNLIVRWPELSLPVRRQVISALLSRTDRAGAVLTALEDGRISPGDLSSEQANFLRTCHDPGIAQRALRIFGPLVPSRASVMEYFRPALKVPGVPGRGRQIFRERCTVCHRLGVKAQRLARIWRLQRFMAKKESLLRFWSRMHR